MPSEQSDFDLLEQWAAGDRNAGAILFARHFDALYMFLRRRTVDAVDDLAQEALLACVENRDRFRREASFRTYLLQIARYRLYAHYQRISRAVVEGDAEGEGDGILDSSPTGKLVRKQDQRIVLHALRRLSPAYQVVLKLSFFDELSGPQIAEVLQIPEATVRSRVWRALKRLREETVLLAGDTAGVRDTATELQTWAERLHNALDTLPLS